MKDQKYIYVSYIKTTPQLLWRALTSSDFTRKYWMGNDVESTWKVGSPIKFTSEKGVMLDGKILAAEEPKRLSYTWAKHLIKDIPEEKPSTVTFEIESVGDLVKLTVTHDDFPENSNVFPRISQGWPMVLSSLKTMLETGAAISFKSC